MKKREFLMLALATPHKSLHKPLIYVKNGVKAGVYACAEHELSIIFEKTPTTSPFIPLCRLDHIADLKQKFDYVIVLYHGGKEHYRYPSPNLQKACRKMVDKGADLVVCQHNHCIGCKEKHKGISKTMNIKWQDILSFREFWKCFILPIPGALICFLITLYLYSKVGALLCLSLTFFIVVFLTGSLYVYVLNFPLKRYVYLLVSRIKGNSKAK